MSTAGAPDGEGGASAGGSDSDWQEF